MTEYDKQIVTTKVIIRQLELQVALLNDKIKQGNANNEEGIRYQLLSKRLEEHYHKLFKLRRLASFNKGAR